MQNSSNYQVFNKNTELFTQRDLQLLKNIGKACPDPSISNIILPTVISSHIICERRIRVSDNAHACKVELWELNMRGIIVCISYSRV